MSLGKPILFGPENASAVLLQPVDEQDLALMEQEAAALEALRPGGEWRIAALPVEDWFTDLTPWPAPPVFGKRAFGDGAARTLEALLEKTVPALGRGRTLILGGYSLAGLFALWAGYRTDVFAAVAAASPSVWYPGWIDYAGANPIRVPRVYLSLGDREEKAKNPTMAAVGDAIRTQHRLLTAAEVPCRLDWNPGNHFVDSHLRMAKGFAWALEAVGENEKRV